MTISIEIPPSVEEALNLHLQRSVRPASVNGQTVLVPMFPTVEAFFESVLGQVFDGLLREYRPPSIAAMFTQIEQLESSLREASRAQVMTRTTP